MHVTEFEGCHLSSPQAKPGQESAGSHDPFCRQQFQVAAVQELLDFLPRDVPGKPREPVTCHGERAQPRDRHTDHAYGGSGGETSRSVTMSLAEPMAMELACRRTNPEMSAVERLA